MDQRLQQKSETNRNLMAVQVLNAIGFNHVNIWLGVHILSHNQEIRPGELIRITEKDVMLSECIIQIRNPKEGSQKAKFAHLWPEEVSVIKSLPTAMPHLNFFRHEKGNSGITAGQPFGPTYLNRWVKRACAIIGIEGITLYPLVKHSTMTAASKVLTPEQIQQWGSKHASKAMLRYMIPQYENTIRYQDTIRELQQRSGELKVIKTKK